MTAFSPALSLSLHWLSLSLCHLFTCAPSLSPSALPGLWSCFAPPPVCPPATTTTPRPSLIQLLQAAATQGQSSFQRLVRPKLSHMKGPFIDLNQSQIIIRQVEAGLATSLLKLSGYWVKSDVPATDTGNPVLLYLPNGKKRASSSSSSSSSHLGFFSSPIHRCSFSISSASLPSVPCALPSLGLIGICSRAD